MAPKEKARELYDEFGCILSTTIPKRKVKQCALIAVDEILLAIQDSPLADVDWDYWKEVKREIEQL
jgi:hypothetical protein